MGNSVEKTREQVVYYQIILLGLVLHISQVIFFSLLRCPIPTYYNVFSVVFYLGILGCARARAFRPVVIGTHLEVCGFVVVCTLCCGWNIGVPLYCLALASLVYFNPFRRKYLVYLFAIGEGVLFLSLYWYMMGRTPLYTHMPASAVRLMYLYNAVACFAMIIYAAFASKLSATVTAKELQKENRHLVAIANYDFLTGLKTRRVFLQELENCPPDRDIIVAIGDLDDFKNINDTYGHFIGDHVLSTVAQLMLEHLGNDCICCRWGGEEFVFLFRNQEPDKVLGSLQQLCKAIAKQSFQYQEDRFCVTMTFGMVRGRPEGQCGELIEQADAQLYIGKQTGKNRVVFDEK